MLERMLYCSIKLMNSTDSLVRYAVFMLVEVLFTSLLKCLNYWSMMLIFIVMW